MRKAGVDEREKKILSVKEEFETDVVYCKTPFGSLSAVSSKKGVRVQGRGRWHDVVEERRKWANLILEESENKKIIYCRTACDFLVSRNTKKKKNIDA